MSKAMRRWGLCLAIMGLVAPAGVAAANEVKFPTRVVRIVVPYVPGGIADITARTLREHLAERWPGAALVVENRPGGATVTATSMVATSPPDGHTMLLTATPFLVNPTLLPKLPYDTERDLKGVSMVVSQSVALVAHPSLKANTLAEFVAEAKGRSVPFSYGSSGVGGISHLAGEMLAQVAGIKMTHVPYRGGAGGVVDVVAGHIPVHFDAGFSSKSQVDEGKLKVLAVTSAKRDANLPNVPTFSETFPGFEATSVSSLVVPAGTPANVVAQISADVRAAVQSPAFTAWAAKLGLEAVASTPADLDAYNRTEIAKWAKLIKDANIEASSGR